MSASSSATRPVNPAAQSSGVVRPHGANAVRRRAAPAQKPNSTRAAGAGGSSQTMLRLYTGDGEGGLKVDPFIIIVLSIALIFSVVSLHIISKIVRAFTK
ncbi:Sec61 protein translocation complex, beta subunit [Phaffia rhodozyma]|uniref:Protein transport protein Sec61 subunit beta n=1 Tax=Phaffia rhodozyma TaxID=264483 RepID=A0A0F7SPM2_PHARH|nr:Sec61 protein translocation complex, beta subunit [Phaffia rhodozyma]